MKVCTGISLVCMLYECTIWSYLQVGYNYMLREAYIANARNNASGISDNSDKYNSFIQVHTQGKEWCGNLPLPHTHMHTHIQAPMLTSLVFLRSYDTQNCSLVSMPLFSFPSLSEHTAQNKMQSESRATPTLHEIKESIIKKLFYC